MIHFYTPKKHQKTNSFRMFSGGIEVEHWLEVDCDTYITFYIPFNLVIFFISFYFDGNTS